MRQDITRVYGHKVIISQFVTTCSAIKMNDDSNVQAINLDIKRERVLLDDLKCFSDLENKMFHIF